MRQRIPTALALLALIIGVTACRPAQAAMAPMPETASSGAAALSHVPSEYHDSFWAAANRTSAEPAYAAELYHDSHWRVARRASGGPAYAPRQYHDSLWRVTAAPTNPTYAPQEYHDSHWPTVASDS
jgi:hypothetical protein